MDRYTTYQFGQNPKSAIIAFQTTNTHLLGYPDQSRVIAKAAIEHANSIEHANTIAYVLFYGAIKLAHCQRDLAAAISSNAALSDLANEHDMAMWRAFAMVQSGWILSIEGHHDEAIEMAQSGLEAVRQTGTGLEQPFAMAQLIEVLSANGKYAEALDLADAAINLVDRTNERLFEAELYRLKGEQLLLAKGADAEAEQIFHHSLEISQKQNAKSWELRTATSLAGLWRRQDRADDARDLLQPVYGWFTEGFETADLIEAKEFLNSLAH